MRRQIAVALLLACTVSAALTAPAGAAFEFYVRIQGPKPAKPLPAHSAPSLSFESDTAINAHAGGAGSGKVKYGEITVTKEVAAANALSSAIVGSPGSSNAALAPAPAPLVHQTVTVGCSGFNVQADFGKGPVKGVPASQSIDGLCIFVVPMGSAAAEAIVRVGLPDTPPGWSFNSQPQSKCVKSGETLDGTLSESQNIFSFMWSPARTTNAMLAPGPCIKT